MEEALIKKAIARDTDAIGVLYDRYAPKLLSACYRYAGNREDAEDILHDGFIKIIQKLETFRIRSEGTLEAWMRKIVVNTALNFLRNRHKDKNFADTDPGVDRTDLHEEEGGDPMEIYSRIDQERLLSLICELPAGYRTVFNLYVFEQFGHKDIAKVLGCSENTSKSQLSKARALLRKKLDQLVNAKTIQTYEKA